MTAFPFNDDLLFCDEDPFDQCADLSSDLLGLTMFNEEADDELDRLLLKEEKEKGVFLEVREEVDRSRAVEWLVEMNCYFGFTPLTCVLAVDFFDRFVGCLGTRRVIDKDNGCCPWLGHLVAVACLSLAAKMEEVQVPLLLDLQVEESKYVFENKTVQRMELLILSTLKWKMNPVTPICYFNNVFGRIAVRTNLHWEFLWRCERLLLSVIVDLRYKQYEPSVLATAVMLYAIKEIEPCNSSKLQNQLMDVLRVNKEIVDGCLKFLMDLFSNDILVHDRTRKWKYNSVPSSPSEVINVSFSCETSNDSWEVMTSTLVSSSEPPFKRSRARDQLMRLH